ncbi:hypothetical protein Tco_1185863 [Tanacetum coccineum]
MEFLSTDLSITYKGLIEKTYIWIEAKEVSTNGALNDHKEGFDRFGKGFSWDNNKGKKKNRDSDWKKGDKDIILIEAVILMVNRESRTTKRKYVEEPVNGIGEITFPLFQVLIIPPIQSFREDSKIPLVGFSGEHSWPLGEVPLEVTIGERPHTRIKTLNFIIVSKRSVDCGLASKRNQAACKEVDKLTKVGILREVKYQTWVAKPRMCVDFTNINNACPKDCYPLPKIDWKVESILGFRLKLFLDAYKGYHQIQMGKGDKDKTTFFTRKGVFCYRKMPFGLKPQGQLTRGW